MPFKGQAQVWGCRVVMPSKSWHPLLGRQGHSCPLTLGQAGDQGVGGRVSETGKIAGSVKASSDKPPGTPYKMAGHKANPVAEAQLACHLLFSAPNGESKKS